MKTLKDFINESSHAEYVCSGLDNHSKVTKTSTVPGAIKSDTVIFKDLNEQEYTVMLIGQKNVKHIKFENCSGTLRLDIRKNKNLETIDFGDCKEDLIMYGVNYLTKNPKLKMNKNDFPSNSTKDEYGNQSLSISGSPSVEDPKNGLNIWK
jgi:hypothetical protein